MSDFSRSLLLNELAAGRLPMFTEQTDGADGAGDPLHIGAPSSAASGVYLEGSILAHVVAQLRPEVHRRVACVYELNHVGGETYTVTIGGNAVAYVSGGADTWEDVVNGLIAALPGVPAAALLVTFEAQDSDGNGTDDTLLIRGRSETAYSLGLTTTGAATMHAVADPESATGRFWRYYGVSPGTAPTSSPYLSNGITEGPGGWTSTGAGTNTITYRGLSDPRNVAGVNRGYYQLSTVTGAVGDAAAGSNELVYVAEPSVYGDEGVIPGARVFIGPCVQETT